MIYWHKCVPLGNKCISEWKFSSDYDTPAINTGVLNNCLLITACPETYNSLY